MDQRKLYESFSLSLALFLLLASTAAAAVVLKNGDFETGNLSQWGGVQQAAPNRASVVTSPRTQGAYAVRIEARTEEQTGGQVGTSRTELWRSSLDASNKGFPVDVNGKSELWLRWSWYIPSTTPTQLPTDCTVGADGCGITIQQQTSNRPGQQLEPNGAFSLQRNMTVTYNDQGMTSPSYQPFWRSPTLATNRWYTVMLHKKYSKQNDGLVEIWLNGVKQQLCANAACSVKKGTITGRTLKTDATQARLQTGLYYNDKTDKTGHKHPVIYLDDFKIYATFPSPPPAPPPPDTVSPTLKVSGAKAQRIFRQRGVLVAVASPAEASTVTARGRVTVRGAARPFRLRPVTKRIAEGSKATLRLKLKRGALKAIAHALRTRKMVRAKVTVSAKDAAGNRTEKRRPIRLKR
jgi:hypothetical protein